MKKTLLLFLFSLCCMTSMAVDYDVCIDGLFYKLDGKEAIVSDSTSYSNPYKGDVVIPSRISFHGNEYKVSSIGTTAFSGCKGLTSITIPTSVTKIEARAFSGCTGLSKITIPNSVTSIGDAVFNGCTGLTQITVPYSVETIGASAFDGCTNLAAISISSTTAIGNQAFDNTAWYNNQPDGVVYIGTTAYKYKGNKIPASVVLKEGTTSIGYEAFYTEQTNSLASITIPNTVTNISDLAFCMCTQLATIDIPSSVTTIGERAFAGCTKLATINIPSSVTHIDNNAFLKTAWYDNQPDGMVYAGKVFYKYKGAMPENTSIVVQDGTLGVAEMAFANYDNSNISDNTGLVSVELPNSVQYISNKAFYRCVNLQTVILPNAITTIEDNTFYKCKSLSSVEIPSSVQTIGLRSFNECTSLSSVNIPSSVTEIQEYAFYNNAFTSIEIPNSVKEIGSDAFGKCSNLTSISLPEELGRLNGGVLEQVGLTSVVVPDNVSAVASSAFEESFNLESVTIGKSVVAVHNSCFKICSRVKEIHCLPTIPPLCGDDIFRNVSETIYSTCTLYVPKGTVDAYKAADGWKKFFNILEEGETGISNVFTERNNSESIYDLNGRRLKTPQHGINIMNGKKVLY